ncbi:hypothetical protein [Saccharomonospora cyanea]|uniref:Uncharacterized protein n=1 Tax=Saccharomonospora cyanea NA-134 TaxID=882082 RepID=H5XDB5_9PSEU|nr:hypothetical protein [Saccharomonospora cyanea]EHR59195.1 hypothetical protein SaccyDRAFT_0258 [Saccharomonospora cyanea NA-134]
MPIDQDPQGRWWQCGQRQSQYRRTRDGSSSRSNRAELSVEQQNSILDATRRVNLYCGAIRSGKAHRFHRHQLMYVRTAPAGPLAMLGKTRDTIAGNVFDVIADMAPPLHNLLLHSGDAYLDL